MVIVTEKKYYMAGYLKANLDTAKKMNKKNWDMLFVTDGGEGSGKTVFTQQAAFYCDPTFNLNRMVFNPDDFKDAVINAQQFQSIVYDEAYGGLNSRATLSRVNRSLVQMLTTIRKKNLYIFIVLPSFFDLDKYIAIWRSRALFHVYAVDWERGYFDFYNVGAKKQLYLEGKKTYSYNKRLRNFWGKFTKQWVVDNKAYEEKKDRTAIKIQQDRQTPAQITKEVQQRIVCRLLDSDLDIPITKWAVILGLSRQTIHNYTRDRNSKKSLRNLTM